MLIIKDQNGPLKL